MFSGSSVIILGAGTSYDFNLPLGGDLFENVLALLNKCMALDRGGLDHIERSSETRHFHADPVSHLMNRLLLQGLAMDFLKLPSNSGMQLIKTVNGARELLVNTTAETFDEFLTLNPTHTPICKLLMTTCFFSRLYGYHDGQFIRSKLAARKSPKGARNWIHLFINTYRTNILRGRDKPTDKIRIVTFNYDSIFQTVLDQLFSASEKNVGPWREHFEIHDVYGSFFELPLATSDPFRLIQQWANNIKTVDEVMHSANTLETVRSAVINCDTLYAAGFAFASDNCQLIGLDKRSNNRQLRYLNYDGSPGLADRVDRYAIKRRQKAFSRDDNLMTMDRAIGLGLFGEMPM